MSYQRKGKSHMASAAGLDRKDQQAYNVDPKKLRTFLGSCVEQLELAGQDDAAFYFEQLQTYLEDEWSPGKPFDAAHRVLGL
jgi:hypothetical protein